LKDFIFDGENYYNKTDTQNSVYKLIPCNLSMLLNTSGKQTFKHQYVQNTGPAGEGAA
jgi:hypothetical protein